MTFPYGFAGRNAHIRPSAIREALKVTARPDIISFAGGLPASDAFPVAEIEAACRQVLSDPAVATQALQYGPSEGFGPLRELLAAELATEGVSASADEVLVTTGSQQGLDLLGKVLLDPGDAVIVEDPSYLGALTAFNAYEARYLTVRSDAQGLRVDDVERAIGEARSAGLRPKMVYLVPNFANPTGATLSPDRRSALVAVCAAHGVPIVEDDPYVLTRFEGAQPPPLKAQGGDGVVLLRSFSKTVSPGFRVGVMVAPPEVFARVLAAKQASDLHTSTFVQHVLHAYLATGHLEGHLAKVREAYRRKRDAMVRAMTAHFPPGCTWTVPSGGLFLWVTLPPGTDADAMLPEAVAERVAYIPGSAFHAVGGGQTSLRLNFSQPTEAQIDEGIARLAKVLRRRLAPVGAS